MANIKVRVQSGKDGYVAHVYCAKCFDAPYNKGNMQTATNEPCEACGALAVMRFPGIKAVARYIAGTHRVLPRYVDASEFETDETPGTDIRLQVFDDGSWAIHTGDASYDTDHNGYWGASFLPLGRTNSRELAKDLLAQAKDHYYSSN